MSDKFPLQAISEVADPEKIRVVIFINGEMVHVPLSALLAHMQDQIDALDARVTALETPDKPEIAGRYAAKRMTYGRSLSYPHV